MSQSDVADNSLVVAQGSPPDTEAASVTRSILQAVPRDHATLLVELEQTRSLNQQRVNRIYYLEQGLDQAVACLSELRSRVQDQEVLEAQLALTEDFANVQQQAIARLKQQLQQQQHLVEAQIVELQAKEQLAEALRSARALDTQRIEVLEAQSQGEHTQASVLTTQLHEARQHVQALSTSLAETQERLAEVEAQLEQTSSLTDDQQNLALVLRRTQTIAAQRNTAIAALQKELALTQIKVDELETQLAKQVRTQAKWQQNCQELEAESQLQRSRIGDLEQEVAEMQDHIFHHSRQAIECETAIQHWKDRYGAAQQQLAQFRELLIQALPDLPPDLAADDPNPITLTPALLQLLTLIPAPIAPETESTSALASLSSPFNPLDVPDFLIRRRMIGSTKGRRKSEGGKRKVNSQPPDSKT